MIILGKFYSSRQLCACKSPGKITCILIFCLLVFTPRPISSHDHRQMDRQACLKPACIDAASEIQQSIDSSIQPCDDFYTFACGGFIQKTSIPANKRGFDLFNNMSNTVDDQAKTMLEESTGETGSKAFKLVKKLYDACTNSAAIEREGFKSIMHYLNEFGGWPLLKHASSNTNAEQDWIELSSKLRKLGFGDYLISLSVEPDPRNDSHSILTIGYPHLVAHKDWNDSELEAYRSYLTNAAVALGANRNEAAKEFEESSNFELQLANIQGQEQERAMLIRELEFNYPGIPWLQFINNIVNSDGDGVTYDDAVMVKSPQFILNVIQMLKYASKQTITNYLISRAVTSMIPYSTNALRNEDLTFRKSLHSSTEYDPRWKECLHVVSGRLHVAMAALFARKYFSDNKLSAATEIANDVQSEFVKLLSQAAWMDQNTRDYAQKKLEDMKKYIGFPKELLDNNKIDNYYSLLEPNTNSYLQLIKEIDLFNVNKHYEKLSKSGGDNTWAEQSHTNTIAAFYNPRENALQFPAGLLQEPFFNNERPHYMNYGTLGSLIGHEIVHGFDNEGKHYDEDGGLENWWSPRTESDYARATRCITDHYVNAGVPEIGLNVNNLDTQDEIIADIAGVKQAYLAYQKWTQHQNVPELPLPGLNYTQNQLFWISAASIWCSKYQNTNGENYSPGSFRVYESFRNLEQFSSDFDCPIGSNMNPEQKCTVW